MLFLSIALLLTAAALAWLGWYSYRSYSDADLVRQQDSRIEKLRGRIVHLDEVLTMSARMAAATGDLRWENRYRSFEPKLDAAIKEAIRLAPEAYRGAAAAETDAANIKLVEMEKHAFGLVRRGRDGEAKVVLFSDEYKTQKQIYARGMTRFAHQGSRHLRLVELRGVIIHFDEVLTMSARMAAATGDLRWESRYRRFEPKLDAAIKEAVQLAPHAHSNKAADKTDAANIKLVAMENRAFDLVRRGRADEARAVLFSDEYETQKRVYAEGMEEFARCLADAAVSTIVRERHQAFLYIATAGLSIPFIAVAWLVVFRTTRKWEADLRAGNRRLVRQAEELVSLNKALDQRVSERTTELTRANEGLRSEVAERKHAEEKLNETLTELERFNRLAVGREERMIELKREVNEMARKAGAAPPYDLSFARQDEGTDALAVRKDR